MTNLRIEDYVLCYCNNNKVYTPLSERCSQSIMFISQCHMNHIDNTVRIIYNGSCSTESHSNISNTNK